MVYIEDIKMYAVAIIIVLVVMFFGIFFYKWYTQPISGAYCGEYNNYYCQVGKCAYITSYESGKVGYCRAKLLGF